MMGVMQDIIDEWIAAGLVTTYDSDEGAILFFCGFAKNQGGMRYDRESPSVFPCPPGYERTNSGLTPAKVRTSDGVGPGEHQQEDQHQYQHQHQCDDDDDLADALDHVVEVYNENMPNKAGRGIRSQMEQRIKEYGAPDVKHCILHSAAHGANSWAYIDKVITGDRSGVPPPNGNGAGSWTGVSGKVPDYMEDDNDG